MRIIAGEYRSRIIKTPKNNKTRPTTDKIREALFNVIGPYFDGGRLLDIFAGSGAVAIEGLSRGFDKAVLIDKDVEAIRCIKENIKQLDISDRCFVINNDYKKALFKLKGTQRFDLIYIDPPYRFIEYEDLIKLLVSCDLLDHLALIIIETTKDQILNDRYNDIIKYKESIYGISKLTYYQKEE